MAIHLTCQIFGISFVIEEKCLILIFNLIFNFNLTKIKEEKRSLIVSNVYFFDFPIARNTLDHRNIFQKSICVGFSSIPNHLFHVHLL